MPVRVSVRACLLCCAFLPFVLSVTTFSKEYVCQDPDTGTLHELNTTWRSTTFCGNYTCKIRKINTNPEPPKAFVSLFNPQAKISTNNLVNHTSDFGLSKILPELAKDSDRLLNQAEIQKITELLHSVKKSDLQAVLELYNVAQEIYKDMKESENKEGFRASEEIWEDSSETNQLKNSYWHTPANEHMKAVDMNTEGSEYRGTAVYSTPSYSYPPPHFYSKNLANYPSYFTGAVLNNGDVGKIGYNPQVNRQSLPSYYAQRSAYDVSGATEQSPCNPCARAYQYQIPLFRNYPQRPTNMYPYPSSYNYTAQNYNHYYKGNPWAFYDYYKNSYPKQEQTADDKNVVTEAKETEHLWKTDPLSEEIINEIRANIAQRGKLINIPLKKRIKLERVSKVIKLNQNIRKTRSIPNNIREDNNSGQENITKEDIKDPLLSQETLTKVMKDTKLSRHETFSNENREDNISSVHTSGKEKSPKKLLGNDKTATNLNIKSKDAIQNIVMNVNKTDKSSSLETVMKTNSKENVSSSEAVTEVDTEEKLAGQHTVTGVSRKNEAISLEKVIQVNSEANILSQDAETRVDFESKLASHDTVTNVNSKDNATSQERVIKVNSGEKMDTEDKVTQRSVTGINRKNEARSLEKEVKVNSEGNILSQEAVTEANIEGKLASQDLITTVTSKEKTTSLIKVIKVNSEEKVDTEDKLASQHTVTDVNRKNEATSLEKVIKVNSEENILSQKAVTKADIKGNLASQPIFKTVTSIEKVSSRKRNTDAPNKKQENNEMLETYVEKVTCQPTTELGYFKIGNLTAPYPHCCPQKIEDKER